MAHNSCSCALGGSADSTLAAKSPDQAGQVVLRVENMDCPAEEVLIRGKLEHMAGIVALDFEVPERRLKVTHRLGGSQPIIDALAAIGMRAHEVMEVKYHIDNMDCPTEEALIRDMFTKMPGIDRVEFDMTQRTLTVAHTLTSSDPIEEALTRLGMRPVAIAPSAAPHTTMLSIPSMDCPTEEKQIRTRLESMPDIVRLDFDLPRRQLKISHCLADIGPIYAALSELGMPADAAFTPRDVERVDTFHIDTMDCPTEEGLIRSKLSKLSQVESLEFNLPLRELRVTHRLGDVSELTAALDAIGMHGELVRPPTGSASESTVFRIDNMDCPTEEALIRDKLRGVQGITELQFNLMQRKLSVKHTPQAFGTIVQALKSIGFDPVIETAAVVPARKSRTAKWWLMGIGGAAAVASEVAFWVQGGNTWLVVVLCLVAVLSGGWGTYKKGWIALRNRNLNMNALMSIAVTGAMVIGQWPEAAVVMFLFALAETIEALSLDRARNAIRGLMELAPEVATVRQDDGRWSEVAANTVSIGQIVRVKPGERIALDGIVLSGNSTINQAPITGESIPVDKAPGDQVFAGTINETGSFDFRVTALVTGSTIARIIHAVEQAQGTRAPTQRFVDQFARIYTPVVFALAIAVALVLPLAFAQPWLDWIYRALVLLVIACPCALVISTPVTVVSGLAAAARRGILIKGGVYLEQGRKLKALALDKTGTLTVGKPAQTLFEPLTDDARAGTHLHAVAVSLARRSDHPVSKAIAAASEARIVNSLEVEAFKAIPGRGVTGVVAGEQYYLANPRLMQELGLLTPRLEELISGVERTGNTVVVLSNTKKALAVFAVADEVRETSRGAIAELHALGVRSIMLTGDNPQTAGAIAAAVGIDDARGSLLPEDKLAAIDDLLSKHGEVGMAGDGINDAPALAKASIGFAMGAAGTDTALETADVALMDDDLRKIAQFIRLSRKTRRVLMQNIAVSLGIKAVFFVLAITGQATLWMAVFADMGASLIVVFNGLRLLATDEARGAGRPAAPTLVVARS